MAIGINFSELINHEIKAHTVNEDFDDAVGLWVIARYCR